MKYEIKNRWSRSVIFEAIIEYDGSNESIKLGLAVRAAVLQGAYLRDADLQGADLRDADLREVYLQGADLRDADLQGADLRDADLQGAYLRDADLRGADLRDADLQGADLQGADLQGADLRGSDLQGAKAYGYVLDRAPIQIYDKYQINIWDGFMVIGCEKHTIADWLEFDDRRIIGMGGKEALVWWDLWKPVLISIINRAGRDKLPE